MKDNLSDKIRLLHILDAIQHIENFSLNRNKADIYNDFQLRFSLERQLEIIGEAANHVTSVIHENNVEVEWPKIISFRNFLAHEYFGVDLELLWGIIIDNIPLLKKQISTILSQLESEL